MKLLVWKWTRGRLSLRLRLPMRYFFVLDTLLLLHNFTVLVYIYFRLLLVTLTMPRKSTRVMDFSGLTLTLTEDDWELRVREEGSSQVGCPMGPHSREDEGSWCSSYSWRLGVFISISIWVRRDVGVSTSTPIRRGGEFLPSSSSKLSSSPKLSSSRALFVEEIVIDVVVGWIGVEVRLVGKGFQIGVRFWFLRLPPSSFRFLSWHLSFSGDAIT